METYCRKETVVYEKLERTVTEKPEVCGRSYQLFVVFSFDQIIYVYVFELELELVD